MLIKDSIIKKIAVNKVTDRIISEAIIEKIIGHQFESAVKATATNNSVEISGFGKFVFNIKKAKKQMEKYKSQEKYLLERLETVSSEVSKRNLTMRLNTTMININALAPKLESL